eukprot:scaffold97332_cov41-Attheya_sp.AAC.1
MDLLAKQRRALHDRRADPDDLLQHDIEGELWQLILDGERKLAKTSRTGCSSTAPLQLLWNTGKPDVSLRPPQLTFTPPQWKRRNICTHGDTGAVGPNGSQVFLVSVKISNVGNTSHMTDALTVAMDPKICSMFLPAPLLMPTGLHPGQPWWINGVSKPICLGCVRLYQAAPGPLAEKPPCT